LVGVVADGDPQLAKLEILEMTTMFRRQNFVAAAVDDDDINHHATFSSSPV